MKLGLLILAIVLFIIAGLVGFSVVSLDNAKDSEEAFRGLLAFGLASGFAGLTVP